MAIDSKNYEFGLAEKIRLDKLRGRRQLTEEEERLARKREPSTFTAPTSDEMLGREVGSMLKAATRTKPLPKLFLVDELNELIPSHPSQLLLLGAVSGSGKSTVLSNMATALWKQDLKVLVITNEEPQERVFNRMISNETGISFNDLNENKITEVQLDIKLAILAKIVKCVTVIDMKYKDDPSIVVTLDGLKAIFDNFPDINEYSLIVIDYYNKFTEDTQNTAKQVNEVQQALSNYLDVQCNRLECPIAIFIQLKQDSAEEKLEFENKIKGRKTIYEVCSEAVEIKKVEKDFATDWIVHKSRFDHGSAKKATTGFHLEKKLFVSMQDADYMGRVVGWQIERYEKEMRLAGKKSPAASPAASANAQPAPTNKPEVEANEEKPEGDASKHNAG